MGILPGFLSDNSISNPRDPGSPSENGFMEPKYLSFRFGDCTPQSSSDKVIGSLGFMRELEIILRTGMNI